MTCGQGAWSTTSAVTRHRRSCTALRRRPETSPVTSRPLPKIRLPTDRRCRANGASSDLLLAAGAIPASVAETADAAAGTNSTPAPPPPDVVIGRGSIHVPPVPRPPADAREETVPALTGGSRHHAGRNHPATRVVMETHPATADRGRRAGAVWGFTRRSAASVSASRQIELERRINAGVPFATSPPQTESNPRFAPDGSRFVFARSSETTSEIVIQDITSGAQRAFSVANARHPASPVFMPDGKRVARVLVAPHRTRQRAAGLRDCTSRSRPQHRRRAGRLPAQSRV